MGYRSDVSLVLYTRKYEEVSPATLHFWFDENYPHQVAEGEWFATITKGEDYVLIEYDSVKWYPDFSHVQAVRDALAKFTDTFDADDRDDVAWEMIEIGEELEDIKREASGYSDWRLDVSRTIHFN